MTMDFGINTGFVEELYAQYLENPESVDASWRSHFDARLAATASLPTRPLLTRATGAACRSPTASWRGASAPRSRPRPSRASATSSAEAAIQARVYKLLNAYRVRGHLFAHVDPLGAPALAPPELDLRNFDLRPEDLDKPFPTIDLAGMPPFATLREILKTLEETLLPHHRRGVHPHRGIPSSASGSRSAWSQPRTGSCSATRSSSASSPS